MAGYEDLSVAPLVFPPRFHRLAGDVPHDLDRRRSGSRPGVAVCRAGLSGNTGGTPFFAGDRAYNPATDFSLGTHGIDTANNQVWAVVNHNSQFAAVPEPAELGLIGSSFVFRLDAL